MKVVFFGTPDFVIPVLDSLLEHFDVVGVITAPDKKTGRKQILAPSPIKDFCKDRMSSAQVFTPEKFDDETIKRIKALQADIFVVAAYGKILPASLLSTSPLGAINIHPSLLPKHRGPSPIQQTLLDGDKSTGVCLIKMDEKVDHGPILASYSSEIHETDTFELLAKHLFSKAAEMIKDVLTSYASESITPVPQKEGEASNTSLITKDMGYFDLKHPPEPEQLGKMIMAYHPWPGVWTKIRVKDQELRIKLLPPQSENSKFCIQIEGKKPMIYKDFINGYKETEEVEIERFLEYLKLINEAKIS